MSDQSQHTKKIQCVSENASYDGEDRRQYEKKFECVNEHAFVGGVIGGIAFKYELSVTILRVLFLTFMIALFYVLEQFPTRFNLYVIMGVVAVYFLVWMVAPKCKYDPEEYESHTRMKWFDK